MAEPLRALFDWEDPIHLETQLNEDERLIAATSRACVQDNLEPHKWPFGNPLAGTQFFQKKLADMQSQIPLDLHAKLPVARLFDEVGSRLR